MAKAKKSESASGSKKQEAAPKKAPAAPAPAPQQPLIDTHLAAEAAAKLVANRDALAAAAPAGPEGHKPASAAFKQLKQSLAQPHAKSLDNLLGTTAAQKKGGLNFAIKQVGHNQTFGADVNRHNIPRRTSGG